MIFRRLSVAALLACLWVAAAFVLPNTGPVTTALAQFADQANVVTSPGGTANAQTGTVANATSYTDVQNVLLKITPSVTNTGATTLTLNGFGSSPQVRKPTSGGLVPLTGQELVISVPSLIMYNGTYFVIMSTNTAQSPIAPPQGYVTPCNFANSPAVTGCIAGSIIPTGNVTSVATLYYQTAFGNQVPIYNGATMVMTTFTELTLAIPSSRLANTLYDVFVISDAGTVRLAFGPAWSSSTAGSGARGTGAGTAELTQVQGIWVNAVSISAVNGASTYSVSANQATYVGTAYIDGTNGQVTFHRTAGQNRKWAFWNLYNQQPIALKQTDATASWVYNATSFQAQNTTANNSIFILTGMITRAVVRNKVMVNSPAQGTPTLGASVGIGVNSVTVNSATIGIQTTTSTSSLTGQPTADLLYSPNLGVDKLTALEAASGTSTNTWYGGEVNSLMNAQWDG